MAKVKKTYKDMWKKVLSFWNDIIYFEGGAKSRYGVRIGCFKDKGRYGNYSIT